MGNEGPRALITHFWYTGPPIMHFTTLKSNMHHVTHDNFVTPMRHCVMSLRSLIDGMVSNSFIEYPFSPYQVSQNCQISGRFTTLARLFDRNQHDLPSPQSLASILR
mgnify:CR=1 FL=1|jgi:hypothetical protein